MATEAELVIDYLAGLPALFRTIPDADITTKPDLSTPWRDGDFAYASDGRIMARVHREAVEWHVWEEIPDRDALGRDGRPRLRAGTPGALFAEHVTRDRYTREPTSLPAVLTATQPCDECDGNGRAYGGTVREIDHACEDCDGTGSWWNTMPVEVAPSYFLMGRYVALLWDAGAVVHLPSADEPGAPAYFRADDCEGLVMPMEPEAARRALEEGT